MSVKKEKISMKMMIKVSYAISSPSESEKFAFLFNDLETFAF